MKSLPNFRLSSIFGLNFIEISWRHARTHTHIKCITKAFYSLWSQWQRSKNHRIVIKCEHYAELFNLHKVFVCNGAPTSIQVRLQWADRQKNWKWIFVLHCIALHCNVMYERRNFNAQYREIKKKNWLWVKISFTIEKFLCLQR